MILHELVPAQTRTVSILRPSTDDLDWTPDHDGQKQESRPNAGHRRSDQGLGYGYDWRRNQRRNERQVRRTHCRRNECRFRCASSRLLHPERRFFGFVAFGARLSWNGASTNSNCSARIACTIVANAPHSFSPSFLTKLHILLLASLNHELKFALSCVARTGTYNDSF